MKSRRFYETLDSRKPGEAVVEAGEEADLHLDVRGHTRKFCMSHQVT
jgi:hypothetical protein